MTKHTTMAMPKMPVRMGFPPSGLAILRTPTLRRIRWATERNEDVAARRTVDLHPDGAVVDVEERPVRAKCVEPQVILGERFDDLVDVALALVEALRERPHVLDDALDGTAALLQQRRQVIGGRRQRRDGACDGVAILREPGDQLLQLIDAGVELRALLVDRGEHRVEVVDHVADELVTGSEVLAEGARGGEQVVDGTA